MSSPNVASAPRPVRIAHLSDIHLGPLPAFGPRDWNLKRGLGFINWQRARRRVHRSETLAAITSHLATEVVDHVLVSGDLVNLGMPREFELAASWLAALGAPRDVSVVPGNHDRYVSLRRDPGIARWRAYMTGDAGWSGVISGPTDAVPFPYVRELPGHVAVIGVNSAHPTGLGYASGRIGALQLTALQVILAQARRRGLFRLVMLHHPPLPGQAPLRRGLTDATDLAAVLAAEGAELVIHGHNHVHSERTLDSVTGPIPVIGIGTASAARRRHGEPLASYQVYAIGRREGEGWTIGITRYGLATEDGPVQALHDTAIDVRGA